MGESVLSSSICRRNQMLAVARPQADLAYPISDGVYRWRTPEGTWERLAL